ncbi:hypothetical protein PENTCL1PPCAC_10903, partial [Pristionchus entomophagus]
GVQHGAVSGRVSSGGVSSMPPPPTTTTRPSTVEWSTPPTVNRPPSPLPVLLVPAKFVFGFLLTSFLLVCLLVASPFLLLFRLGKYVHDKLVLPRSCDVLWPRPPFTRSFVWLNKQVSLESIKAILDGQEKPVQSGCFIPTPIAPVEVEPWDHEKAPLHNYDDFVTYVKEHLDHVPYVMQVKMVSGYAGPHGRTLLAITTHPDSFQLCMMRILSALSQGNVTVEVEPRVYYECSLNSTFRFLTIRRFADTMAKWLEIYSIGPGWLLFLPRFKPEKVWRALIAERNQVFSTRRRYSLNGGMRDDSETSHLCIASSVQLKQETTASFSITEIQHVDELQKAERLLRATMVELLTSFLAGALRRYFRESDPSVLHPPDCEAAMSVCSHKSSVCDTADPCDHLLLPIQLPIGIEGRIPRLWSLQQQFAQHEKRCTPQALKGFNAISRVILPRETANKVARVFFQHTVLNITFLRIHGDVMLDHSLLTRFIPIPPLSLPSRASFVFVQQHYKIFLVSSIDRGLFDRHTDIFEYMKEEQRGLLDHLSFRLRTLAQTCAFPDRLPSEDQEEEEEHAGPGARPGSYHAPPEAPNNSPSAEREELLPGLSHGRPRRQSMADLSTLLKDVQDELDEMRRHPSVDDRDATIKRLKGLETKIETFHLSMKSELWGNTVWLQQEKDEAMKRVAELLAPYQQQRRVSVTGRKVSMRASREMRRASLTTTEASTRRGSDERREEEGERGEEGEGEQREEREEREERVEGEEGREERREE